MKTKIRPKRKQKNISLREDAIAKVKRLSENSFYTQSEIIELGILKLKEKDLCLDFSK